VLLNLLQNAQQAILQSGQGGLIGVALPAPAPGGRVSKCGTTAGRSGAIQGASSIHFYYQAAGRGHRPRLAIVLGLCGNTGERSMFSAAKGRHAFSGGASRGGHAKDESAAATAVLRLPPAAGPGENGIPRESTLAARAGARRRADGRRLIADVLRDEGMRVDVLRDGESALDRAEHEEYDW